VHPDGSTCAQCVAPDASAKGQSRLLIRLLGESEKSHKKRLPSALLDRHFLRSFFA